jgi:hypothetical protein
MRNSLHWWALQNKLITVTASDYVLYTPHFHLKMGKNSFSETMCGFLTADDRQ